MPRPLSAAVVLAILALAACANGPPVGSAAPAFQATDAQGALVSLGALEGKVLVLDFWATWCAPCREASPWVQKLHEQFAGNDDVVVLGVHYDGAGDPDAYMAEHGYTYPNIPDGSSVVEAYGIRGIPTILVIDRRGIVVHKQVGFWSPQDLAGVAAAVDRAL
jgi:thiol-disulfide isomerase/thioredoxin